MNFLSYVGSTWWGGHGARLVGDYEGVRNRLNRMSTLDQCEEREEHRMRSIRCCLRCWRGSWVVCKMMF